jgi:hypothetical protein
MGLTLSHSQKIEWYVKTCYWMMTTHKLDKIEFVPTKVLLELREFIRSPYGSRYDYVEKGPLVYQLMNNGMQEPIMLMYNQPTRTVFVGEGNHRIAIAKKLGIESLPTRVVRTERKPGYELHIGKKVKGVEPNEYGYVKGSLYPSEIGLRAYSLDKICK